MTAIAEPLTQDPLWSRARAMFTRAVAALGAPAAIAAIALLSKRLRREIVAWLYPLESIVRRLLIAEAAELHRAELSRAKRAVRIERVPLRGMAMHWRPQAKRPSSQREEGREEGRTTGRVLSNMSTPQRPLPLPPPPGAGDAHALACARNINLPATWRASFSFALPRNPRLVPNARAPRILDLSRNYPPPPPPRASREIRPEHAPFRLARRFEALRRVLENPLPHVQRLVHVLAREVRRYSAIVRRAVLAGPRTDDYDRADPRLSIDALGAAWDAPEVFALDSS
jgi:hypothetical protein